MVEVKLKWGDLGVGRAEKWCGYSEAVISTTDRRLQVTSPLELPVFINGRSVDSGTLVDRGCWERGPSSRWHT